MNISFGKSWSKKLQGRIEKFDFEVGVLEDKPHRFPEVVGMFEDPKLASYAGGPIRKATRNEGPLTVGQILIENMKRLNINILQRPFQEESSEIMKFTEAFLNYVTERKHVSIRRVENLLQAIVRNPILRGEYGSNKAITADEKGFNRHLIDTGQTFKAIKARARRV